MRKILTIILFGLLISQASAQTGQLQPGQVFGNPTGSQGLPQPATIGQLLAQSGLINAPFAITGASTTAFSVGLTGATNPAFNVDTSTASQVAGLNVKGAATGGTVAISTTDSGASNNLSIDAKGTGTIVLGGVSTGSITLTRATTLSNALTYGGVTLSNSVTGTGSMVLSTSPSVSSLTVTTGFTATGLVTYADMATAAITTSSQYFSGAANTLVPASVIYSTESTTTFGSTTTFDFSTFINTAVTLTGNITTMTLNNTKAGQAGQIRFIQDGSGSRTTVWNSTFKFVGGVTPTLSTAPGAIDVLFYSCASSSLCYASLSLNMK
jgi:hypothetical protein